MESQLVYALPTFVSPGPRGGMGVLLGYTPQIPIQSPVSSGAVGPKGTDDRAWAA